jgi:DNA-binding beta-propeller fold protein YncE
MRTCIAIFVSAVGFSFVLISAPCADTPAQNAPLTFVRQFSSAADLKGESHPILNKTLDIIAGPKEESPPPPSILQQPYAVTTDSAHRIFVTDLGSGSVHIFDFARGDHSLLHGGDHLRTPMGIAADREGNIYVSDSSLHNVLVYDAKGKFVRYLKKPQAEESYFAVPRGISVDPATDHIYVCDSPRHMVIVLNKRGRVLATLGTRGGGSAPGQFKNPIQVVASEGEIAVLDQGNSRVQVLDSRGHLRRDIKLANPGNRAGLAMDSQKNLYVSDPDLNRLQVFSHDGQSLYQFGQMGNNPGQFNGITGLWVDSGHCLYTADTKNRRVELFAIAAIASHPCL